jgi:hypothetical protein
MPSGHEWLTAMSYNEVMNRGAEVLRNSQTMDIERQHAYANVAQAWFMLAHSRTRRTRNTASDLHSPRSEAAWQRCSIVAPTGFEPALPP